MLVCVMTRFTLDFILKEVLFLYCLIPLLIASFNVTLTSLSGERKKRNIINHNRNNSFSFCSVRANINQTGLARDRSLYVISTSAQLLSFVCAFGLLIFCCKKVHSKLKFHRSLLLSLTRKGEIEAKRHAIESCNNSRFLTSVKCVTSYYLHIVCTCVLTGKLLTTLLKLGIFNGLHFG